MNVYYITQISFIVVSYVIMFRWSWYGSRKFSTIM